jgi:cytidylate kinase
MKAIRGATTVSFDTPEEIRESVKELLCEIKAKNNLCEEDIVCIMFSNTADIKSFYPAKAAREAGFFSCALFSSLEPSIEGSLERCIRVMVLTNSDSAPEHVYLRDAKKLRKDITKLYNIAIDGPAGSGKSTISKIIAKKFNILYLDTGAMYRAFALACKLANVDTSDEKSVEEVLKNTNLSVEYREGAQRTILNGKDVSSEIRSPEISMLASKVSAHGCVRERLVSLQRDIAKKCSCVLDGRDIGTNVLPNAEFKFFLTASPEVRAERRLNENKQKGINQSYEDVLDDIIKRDKQDTTRKIAPLKKADDATEVDTSNLSIEEVTALISNKIQEKI